MIKLFEVFSIFDWITPIVKSAESWQRDPWGQAGKCCIDYTEAISSGWDQVMIKAYLSQNGVEIFGEQYAFPQDELTFYILPEDFDNATWLLSQAGVPLKFITR